MDPIPDERNISRQDLWKRIGDVRDTLENRLGELNEHEKRVAASFKKELEMTMGEALNKNQAIITKLNDLTDKNTQYVLIQLKETEMNLRNVLRDHTKMIEAKFQDLRLQIPKLVNDEAGRLISDINLRVNVCEDAVEDMDKAVNKSLTKFQSDTGVKVSELRTKLDDVLGKFRGLLGKF